MFEVEAESIIPLEIFERDGWVCQLCNDKVDPDLTWPDPLSRSLDHIVPLSKGGSHVAANVQLAHLRCNQCKHAGVSGFGEQLRMVG